MPIDVTSARVAFAAALFGDVATVARTSASVAGKFGARRLQQTESGAVAVPLGSYTFKCALASDIIAGDVLTIAGRVFRVVYAPPASALSLALVVGLEAL